MTRIERITFALGEWLYDLGDSLMCWSENQESGRAQMLREADYGPWEDVDDRLDGFAVGDEFRMIFVGDGIVQYQRRCPLEAGTRH